MDGFHNVRADDLWYFGYGSMTNPISLRRRGILPSKSVPVRLYGYELEFSMTGMANIVECEGATMHGVAHLVTPEMFNILSKIECVYDYTLVTCHPYGTVTIASNCTDSNRDSGGSDRSGQCRADSGEDSSGMGPIVARAFIVPPDGITTQQEHLNSKQLPHKDPPSERYIQIITDGLLYYGADASWIQHIQAQPFEPRRQRSEWVKIPEAPHSGDTPLPAYTLAQIREHLGRLPAVYAVGRKVVRARGGEEHPFASILKLLSGQQACVFMLMNLYDPSLPPMEGAGDLQEIHVEWAEDQAMKSAIKFDYVLEHIGYLVEEQEQQDYAHRNEGSRAAGS